MSHSYQPGELAAAEAARNYVILSSEVAPSRIVAAEWSAAKATEFEGARIIPAIKYFKRSAETQEVRGSAAVGEGEIFVRSDLSLPHTAEVAAHETVHALGSADEERCYAIGSEVKAAWIAHRYELRELLAKRWNDLGENFSPMPARNLAEIKKRVDVIRIGCGLKESQWRLTGDELDLRADELEELFQIVDASPAGHLKIRATKPPPPSYSYQR